LRFLNPRIGFIVKLIANHELSRGENEVECLQKLHGLAAVQHVIATMVIQGRQANSITWFNGRKIQKLNHLGGDLPLTTASTDFVRFNNTIFDVSLKTTAENFIVAPKCEGSQMRSWWNFPTKNQVKTSTAVVTCKGHTIVRPSSEILTELNKLLGEIHQRGVFHCDLRAPNILYFEVGDISDDDNKDSDTSKTYRFIDFDLAEIVPGGQSTTVQLSRDGQGARVRMVTKMLSDLNMRDAISKQFRITWTAELDFSFLASTLKMKAYPRHIPYGAFGDCGENCIFS
jgi:serine/threonine protein kinase